VFVVEKMDCPAEEQLIRARFASVPAVSALAFDLMARELTVTHNTTDGALLEMLAPLDLNATVKRPEAAGAPAPSSDKPTVSRMRWTLLAISGLAALGAEALAWSTGNEHSVGVILLALLSISVGGLDTLKRGWIALRTLALNIHFLMSLAVIGAAAIGQWPEAAVVIFLFALAELIESLSLDRARNAIRLLLDMAPDTANVRMPSGEWQDMPSADVKLDSTIRIRPGERLALDGVVAGGESSVNQAPITGESMPVAKRIGDTVFAGTINQQGMLEVRVTAAKGNTTLDHVIRTVREAQSARAPTQRLVDRLARYYTPTVVIVAVLVAALPPIILGSPFVPWLYKALVLLVIACPCALVISTPVTIVSGLAAAAHSGILVKGGAYLEEAHRIRAIALDKTGTLTLGRPVVTDFLLLTSNDEQTARRLAAALDSHSNHPIARAIVSDWTARNNGETSRLPDVTAFEAVNGFGVRGTIDGMRYLIGNHRWIEELGICSADTERGLKSFEKAGKTVAILASATAPIAVFAVADALRATSIEAIAALHQRGIKTIMLTGDNPTTAAAIASQAGIDDVRANLLPEEKLAAIEELIRQYSTVGMVGDGINDAPALAKASIGFAMGAAGSDVALETADVALMEDDLRKLPEFFQLSRATVRVLWQNIAFAIAVKLVFFGLALAGIATLWMAVFADMGASLIVVFNGLRLISSPCPRADAAAAVRT
jgi:Cd2+/Zn2+-exporting ATPase